MHGMRRWPPWAADYPARLTSITALTQASCAWGIYHGGMCHILGVATAKASTSASADQRATSLKTRRSPPALTLT